MKNKLIFTLLILLLFSAKALGLIFTNSNLPIVIITTDNNPATGKPYDIPDDPKVLATMKIIYRPDGTRNYVNDQNTAAFLNYNGRIGIEKRGSSSQDLPKKPYGLETLAADNVTNNNVKILGMSKENDWVLNSLDFDQSLIRNLLSYDLARNMGNYAARGRYCEVIINGDYKGLYVLMEKLKIDKERINIIKMTTSDNVGSVLSGGYIAKCDKLTGGDVPAWQMYAYNGMVDFIYESPKPEEITTQQGSYIRNQFLSLQSVMTAQNSSITTGYPSIIDVPSFVDFMILNELSSNPDGYQLSTFFHKDRNGKLRAGPIWDFNLTYGNDLFEYGFDRSKTYVWQFSDGGNDGAKFWKDLFINTTFKCYLSKRWMELTAAGQPLNFDVISERMDELVALTAEAAVREQSRWNRISSHTANISAMKTWIKNRTTWLNAGLSNYQACAQVQVPALVISKIHYNPATSGTISGDSLEFIEITNNSNLSVDLTGVYFKELGLTYRFPINSKIDANDKIYLAASSNTFESIYGVKPFGQFTRNLSDKSENLVLADAFGNVIDYVGYSSESPWPTEANGFGPFLKLVDLSYDNSQGSSWTTSNNITGVHDITLEDAVKVYPMPAKPTITVYCAGLTIESYEITDLMGRVITNNNYTSSSIINVEHLAPNIYFLKLNFANGTRLVKKIIKD